MSRRSESPNIFARDIAVKLGAKLRPLVNPERHSEVVEEIYRELVDNVRQR